ncbi:MAG: bifunctional pyr operon transcriptional regulator/uracil phosphoribosyltransferase PyrR [Verrucomicrobia bacterium]|nr:bifunctional pyr operon transcriptional regulator/uracil phosphoribosyltransferase PyrR [Verrucomicrobiota bacterium]
MGASKTIGPGEIEAAIARLAAAISARHPDPSRLLLLGIANGGVELARRLATRLAAPAGVLDVSFHRDDIGRHPIPKESAPTVLPREITGAEILLVDDVIFTGRTVKAALDELFDHGRPARVELAVLVDRGCRRLPFLADYVGLAIPTGEGEKVAVHLAPGGRGRDSVRVLPAGPPPV